MRSPLQRLSQFGLCRIARAISRQTAQLKTHQTHERTFWESQLHVARRLNLITGIGTGVALISLVGAISGLLFVGLSFRVSKQAAEDAELATVTANRAWVKPDPPVFHDPFPSKVGDPILVYLPYEDLGKQIALNMQEYHEHEWVTPSNTSYLDLGPNTTCEKVTPSNISTIIWPGGAVPVYATYDKLNEIPRATTEFLAGSTWLVYRGCITYDTFERTRYSKYCYFFNPTVNMPLNTWNWTLCPGRDQNGAN
jgi:hypothetical protein